MSSVNGTKFETYLEEDISGNLTEKSLTIYKILDIDESTASKMTEEEFKKKLKNLWVTFHPDKNIGNEDKASKVFQMITTAAECFEQRHLGERNSLDSENRYDSSFSKEPIIPEDSIHHSKVKTNIMAAMRFVAGTGQGFNTTSKVGTSRFSIFCVAIMDYPDSKRNKLREIKEVFGVAASFSFMGGRLETHLLSFIKVLREHRGLSRSPFDNKSKITTSEQKFYDVLLGLDPNKTGVIKAINDILETNGEPKLLEKEYQLKDSNFTGPLAI